MLSFLNRHRKVIILGQYDSSESSSDQNSRANKMEDTTGNFSTFSNKNFENI